MKPFFSIITVCFNALEALKRTIKNLESQSFKDFEHIIIDGGSSDGSVDFIRSYAQKNKHVIWVSEKDNGIYDAMNKGITKVRGEWINFMNAGDCFKGDQKLAVLHNVLNKTNSDVLYGDQEVVFDSYREIVKAKPVEDPWVSVRFCHQSAFYRPKCFKKHLYSGKYITSDFEHAFSLYQQAYQFEYYPHVVACFWHDGLNTKNKIKLRYEIAEIVLPHDKRIKTVVMLYKNILWTYFVEGLRNSLPPTFFEKISQWKTQLLGLLFNEKKISK